MENHERKVAGIRPGRPHDVWMTEPIRYWPVESSRTLRRGCAMCDLYATHPKLRAAHVYRTVIATEHFG